MKLVGSNLIVAGAVASAYAHEGYHHQHNEMNHGMNHEAQFFKLPHSHIMFHHVESACAADVEKFCEERPKPMRSLPQTTGDPFLDWIFLPDAQPPLELLDLTRLMDRMFDPLFLEPSQQQVTFFFVEEPHQAPHFLVDSMAAKVAQERQPEEIPQLATDLQAYGKQMMDRFQEGTFEQRMARRLSEVDATTIQHHVNLPFGCRKNRCLRELAGAGKVSERCATSIQQLEATYTLEVQLEQRHILFVGMMWVYVATFLVLLFVSAKKLRSHGYDRVLGLRIIQSIYSNPALKRQVERELGHSVGAVPPVPTFSLQMMSAGSNELRRRVQCIKRTHMVVFLLLLVLLTVAPFWVLPICIGLSIFRVIHLCLLPSIERECECCCCGLTTTDAAAGILTVEQECCKCCKGTGVCSPSCESCCDTCCGCCDGSCCCEKSTPEVGEDCTCCCCAATPSLAREGKLTEEQMCCDCCKGTGVCSAACASCCGTCGCCCCCCDSECCCSESENVCELKGRGQKHFVHARNEVYEGIPVQIV